MQCGKIILLDHNNLSDMNIIILILSWNWLLLHSLKKCGNITDHKSSYIFSPKELNSHPRRGIEYLKDCNVNTHYHPGNANVVADALNQNL